MEPQEKHRFIEKILGYLRFLKKHNMEICTATREAVESALKSERAPQELLAARDLIQFMDEMPGGFLIYFADGGERLIYANKSLWHIFGCDSMREFRALTGDSFRGMVHPDDLEMVEKSIRQQIARDKKHLDFVEYRIRRKDGEIRWLEDYGHFVCSEAVGSFFYVFLADATEKHNQLQEERARLLSDSRKKEQQLQNLIERYDQERALINREYLRRLEVIEGLSINYESILYVDLDADQVLPYRLSTRTRPMFGERFHARTYSTYAAEYVQRWVEPAERGMVACMTDPAYIRRRMRETDSFYLNYRVVVEGEVQYLQLRIVSVGAAENGESQYVMGYRRVDEEVQREMEQKQVLAQALSDANIAMVAKNTFLSNMSHDMRTPLNAILGFTTLARRHIDDPKAALAYLDRAEDSSRQLLDLIEKVLQLAQAESGQTRILEVECDLHGIVREVYEYLQPQAQEKNITFSLNDTQIFHNLVFSDPEKLRQVAMYLVNNAVTYTKPGGQVTISLIEEEGSDGVRADYRFYVQDTGVGISKEFLSRLFEPFARERNTTISGVHGVGLGLTLAKNIVDLMGGTLEACSEVGAGSTFTVSLRFRVQQTQHAEMYEEMPRNAPHRNILLVEDNEINREIETELLTEEGFAVDTAENGSIAVEKVKSAAPGRYDVVLMDIQMPVMDGWQATAAIRRLENPAQAGIPIIALSANVLEDDMRRSSESGMDAHMPKPINITQVVQKIDDILSKKEKLAQE